MLKLFLTIGDKSTWRICRNNSWKSQASEICAEFMIVVFAHQLRMNFGDTVDRSRTLNCQVWCWIAWRILLKKMSIQNFIFQKLN